ncbi:MAG: enoyl-CoA hydratase [Rhodobiaceae bacterium]
MSQANDLPANYLPPKCQPLDSGAARLQAGYSKISAEDAHSSLVGHIVFACPERHNVLDLQAWQALPAVVEQLSGMADMRLIILRGAGDKAFVAGADIAQFEDAFNGPEGSRYDAATEHGFEALAQCAVPTLAAIQGYCIGGGMGLALACDIRLAGSDSQFAIPAARLGLGYPANATRRLAAIVGTARARDILFTARRFDATAALEMGAIHYCVATDRFEAELSTLQAQIAANAPKTLQTAKFILENPDAPEQDIRQRLADCLSSADYAEGRKAFMEKRAPVFRGK